MLEVNLDDSQHRVENQPLSHQHPHHPIMQRLRPISIQSKNSPISSEFGRGEDYDLYVLIVCMNGETYSLKSTPNVRYFFRTFHGNFICSGNFCQKSTEGKSPKKYFSNFVLESDLGFAPWPYV